MEYSETESREFAAWKVNAEAAKEAHQKHFQEARDLSRAAIDFGLEAIRTTAIINGGAVIACLAFVGALYNSERPVEKEIISSLLEAARLFVLGAVLAGVAAGFAYFAQYKYAEAHNYAILGWKHPYVADKPESARSQQWGELWHVWTVCAVIASYVCIIIGLYTAIPSLVS